MSQNSIEIPLRLIDQFGKPIKDFTSSIESATKKFDGIGRSQQKAFGDIKKPISELRENILRYKSAAESSLRTDHIKKYNVLISETQKKIKSLEQVTATCGEKSDGFFGKLKSNLGISPRLFGIGRVVIGLSKAFSFAKESYSESIKAASQVQVYETTLKTMLGTTDKARERMQEYFKIAKQTPFQLNEVVEAGNKLQALGRYSESNLVMMGDLAAASGKPIEQAMAAYTKLVIGEKGMAANMFRDLLITTDDWTKATGKGVSKNGELLASTEELVAALPGILKSKGYLGMMANQAATTEGKVSNLKDAYYQLQVAVGERLKPAYEGWVTSLTKTVDKMKQYVEIPVSQKIAAEKTELNLLVESLINHNGTQEQRKVLIDDINRKYPGLFSNLDLEKAKTSEIRAELEKVNVEYDKKMRKASYQRMREKIESELGEAADDVRNYEMSIQATKKIPQLIEQLNNLNAKLGKQTSINSETAARDYAANVAEKGSYQELIGFGYGGSGIYRDVSVTDVDRAEYDRISGELSANIDAQNFFAGSDHRRLKSAQAKYNKFKYKLSAIDAVIGDDGVDKKDSSVTTTTDTTTKTTTTSTRSDEVKAAADAISGGGKNVKNFNITIGNLIGENVNQFTASTDNPQTASDFVQRFADTLQMLVNEINYADN